MIPAKEKHLAIFKQKFELLNSIVENKKAICDKIGIDNRHLQQAYEGKYRVRTYMRYNDIMSKRLEEIADIALESKKM